VYHFDGYVNLRRSFYSGDNLRVDKWSENAEKREEIHITGFHFQQSGSRIVIIVDVLFELTSNGSAESQFDTSYLILEYDTTFPD
jgi:hypothetical protein